MAERKATGKPPAVRAKENGNTPCGERGVWILSKPGPEVSLGITLAMSGKSQFHLQ